NTVDHAEFDLVRVRIRVDLVEANYVLKIIDAIRITICHVWFDHVAKLEFIILAVEIFSKGRRPDIELEFTVFPYQVFAQNLTHIIERIRIISDTSPAGHCDVQIFEAERQREFGMKVEPLQKCRRAYRVRPGVEPIAG